MELLSLFAGFDAKFLMGLYYIPAFIVLILGSLIVWFITRESRPYVASFLFWPMVPIVLILYGYDRSRSHKNNISQTLFFAGFFVTLLIYGIADSDLVPSTPSVLDLFVLFATFIALIFLIIGIVKASMSTNTRWLLAAVLVTPVILLAASFAVGRNNIKMPWTSWSNKNNTSEYEACEQPRGNSCLIEETNSPDYYQ